MLALLARICTAGARPLPRAERHGRHRGARRSCGSTGVHLGFAAQTDARARRPGRPRRAHDDDRGAGRASSRGSPRRPGPGTLTPGGADRRHLHAEQLRRVRRRRLHADHQPPRGGDARRRPDHRQAVGARGRAGACARSTSCRSPSTTGCATAARPAASCGTSPTASNDRSAARRPVATTLPGSGGELPVAPLTAPSLRVLLHQPGAVLPATTLLRLRQRAGSGRPGASCTPGRRGRSRCRPRLGSSPPASGSGASSGDVAGTA